MSMHHIVRVPATLAHGRLCRLVEAPDGFLLVQVWSGGHWRAEPTASISPSDVRDGIDPTPRILRALGVPEADWSLVLPTRRGANVLLALWALIQLAGTLTPADFLIAA
ncbi:MAG TPA: hypothetical protein VGR60_09705 [Gemmatimonadales bacterium]|nr:hypothetical protein [Gemmatimonadales bacterium]